MVSEKTLVVISYYDRRPLNNLVELLRSLTTHSVMNEFDICIVVNRTNDKEICLRPEFPSIPILYRHNLGMNIGAWDHGWRTYPGYRDYLFLQDECYFVRNDWLRAYRSMAEKPWVGMVGESLNGRWDRSWGKLRKDFATSHLPEHTIAGEKLNRVDFYLNFFREHKVDPGKTGKHLRSVIWFFTGTVLEKIDGFLIGSNYGECIAAEIATTKKVEMFGLSAVQVAYEEFYYIRHLEYNQDWPGAPFTHDPKYINFSSIKPLLEVKAKEGFKTQARRLLTLLWYK